MWCTRVVIKCNNIYQCLNSLQVFSSSVFLPEFLACLGWLRPTVHKSHHGWFAIDKGRFSADFHSAFTWVRSLMWFSFSLLFARRCWPDVSTVRVRYSLTRPQTTPEVWARLEEKDGGLPTVELWLEKKERKLVCNILDLQHTWF